MIWLFLAINTAGILGLVRLRRIDYKKSLIRWQELSTLLGAERDRLNAIDRKIDALGMRHSSFAHRVSELELNQERPANHGAMKAPAKKRTVKVAK